MQNVFGNMKPRKPPASFVAGIFHGIDQSTDEANLPAGGTDSRDCYTPRSVNVEIVNGNVCPRKNYEAVNIDGVALGDNLTYKFKSLFVQPGVSADTLLAGADVYSGAAYQYSVLLKRNLEFSDAWSIVTGGASHSLGVSLSIYFSNANFGKPVTRSGDFFETGAEVVATEIVNGADPPMFYYNGYLYALKCDGWESATADKDADTLSNANFATDGMAVQLYSTTKQMPGGLTAWTTYYVVHAATPVFKVALTAGGDEINITTNGANVIIRENTEASIWYACTPDYTAGNIGTASAIFADNDVVEFKSPTFTLPKELAEGKQYYVVGTSGTTFKVAATFGGTALVLSNNGANVQIRKCQQRWDDAPILESIAFIDERVWGNDGNTVYADGGFDTVEGKANPWDWHSDYAVLMRLDSWDGDAVLAFVTLNGQKFAFKKNSCWYIGNNKKPFAQRQVWTAKGTIAKNSICVWNGIAFYATPEGVMQFDGTTAQAAWTEQIKEMWQADNDDCVFAVVGDFLHVYAYLKHPVAGTFGYAKLVIDLMNGNVCYHDMVYGTPAALTVDCVLDPSFTLLKSGVTAPQYWFAMGDKIYKYGATVPATGAASYSYAWPSTDLGNASTVKYFEYIYITGKGGTCRVTLVLNNVAVAARLDFELPATTAVVPVSAFGNRARIVGAIFENVGGDPVEIHKFQPDFRAVKN